MRAITALGGGFIGATILTAVHESVRRIDPDAPRMDLLGMNALSKLLKGIGKHPPARQRLFLWTMAGDLVSNSLYYSLAGVGSQKGSILRGALLGLSAGLGAVLLPRPLGLIEAPSNRSLQTKVMTVGLYVLGGLATAFAMKLLENKTGHSASMRKMYQKDGFNELTL